VLLIRIALTIETNGRRAVFVAAFIAFLLFRSSDIVEWIDGQTAICPKCLVDSVIGSASGYPITTEFLQQMHDHWF
jgi:hypothetical protein